MPPATKQGIPGPIHQPRHVGRRAMLGILTATSILAAIAASASESRQGWLRMGVTYEVMGGDGPGTVGKPAPGSIQKAGDTCLVRNLTKLTPVGRSKEGTLVRIEAGHEGDSNSGWSNSSDKESKDIMDCASASLVFVPTLSARRAWVAYEQIEGEQKAIGKGETDKQTTWERATEHAMACNAAKDCSDTVMP